MSPEFVNPTDQQTYMQDITNPRYGECNAAAYDLISEMRVMGLVNEVASNKCLLMGSGYLDVLRWVDLRGLKLALEGWRGFHGAAMYVNENLRPADLIKVYETARRLAQQRGLTVFVQPAYSYQEPIQKLDDFLQHSNEGNIPVPDLIGFCKL